METPKTPPVEPKDAWFYIERYWKIIALFGGCYFAYNKDWASNTVEMTDLKIRMARLEEKVSYIQNEKQGN